MRLQHLTDIPVTQNHHATVFRQSLLKSGMVKGHIETMNYAWLDSGMELESHSHPDGQELYFFLEGAGTFTIQGKDYSVQPHDFVIINPGEAHSLRSLSGKLSFMTLRTIDS